MMKPQPQKSKVVNFPPTVVNKVVNSQESWEKEFDKEFNVLYSKKWNGLLIGSANKIKSFIHNLLYQQEARIREEVKITGETSDGYHSFNELYEFRKIYNALIFNEWASQGKYNIHKSKKHFDGEDCFGGGWFIVMATLPTGQISNHYELKDWDLFKCEEHERAEEWDGHTAQDVAQRITDLLSSNAIWRRK